MKKMVLSTIERLERQLSDPGPKVLNKLKRPLRTYIIDSMEDTSETDATNLTIATEAS